MPEASSPVKNPKQAVQPTGSVVINGVTIYYFCPEIIHKYDFLKKANEAITLAIELLAQQKNGTEITDEQYLTLDKLINDIKADHLVETGILPMNAPATKKYQAVIKQLEWTLAAIY